MSWQKSHDLAVKTGEYTGTDGKVKGRYENVGHILHDGDQRLICLKRTFNPAGAPNPDGRDTVVLAMFEVRDRDERAAITRSESAVPARQAAAPAGDGGGFDDSIPFAPCEYGSFA
jgi:hypothetical protein